jgi:hypothetical protein
MRVSFNMLLLFDAFMFFKRKNFTVTKEFNVGDVTVKEYIYNMSRYFTDVWPPNISAGQGFPIMSVIRDDDGTDVTKSVLKFSGPRKNYVHPLGTLKRKRYLKIACLGLSGGVRFSIEEKFIPYEGTVTVTDIFGKSMKQFVSQPTTRRNL